MIRYWDMRKVVFGEKAYLPMTLHGGCLSETDVENLKLGHFCILPPDNYGRAVLYECRGHLDDTGLNYASLVSHSGDSGLDSEEAFRLFSSYTFCSTFIVTVSVIHDSCGTGTRVGSDSRCCHCV